jgi:putative aminopeptidase FrvX
MSNPVRTTSEGRPGSRKGKSEAPRSPANAMERKRLLNTLLELTAIPTAAGCEDRVIAWIKSWVGSRTGVTLSRDEHGNLLLKQGKATSPKGVAPIWFQAHLDHPAFVVRSVGNDGFVELEFRGGVHDPYFVGAALEIFDRNGATTSATIASLDPQAKPFKLVRAKIAKRNLQLAAGDVGRWRLPKPRITKGLVYTHACDDLAAVAAALCAFDRVREKPQHGHVGVFLTRAEEIGFIGTIGAARNGSLSKESRIICLENSRSFAESPIGGGPIVRVGDRRSVFVPALTNRISDIMAEWQKSHPDFRYQRKLMPGGTCEATAFACYGHSSTCLCLPLGNYHNMIDIDGVVAGRGPARVGPEFIAAADYLGLIDMLEIIASELDSANVPPMTATMETLWKDLSFVLS